MTYLFFDCETTGFDPITNELIYGYGEFTDEHLNTIDTITLKVCPESFRSPVWTSEAYEIHRISPGECRTFPTRKEAVQIALDKLQHHQPSKFIIHAHPSKIPIKDKNSKKIKGYSYPHFDWHFLEWMFRKEDMQYELWKILRVEHVLSTITLARVFGESKNKLSDWAVRLNYPLDHHNPVSDTKCTIELYKYLSNRGLKSGSDRIQKAVQPLLQ